MPLSLQTEPEYLFLLKISKSMHSNFPALGSSYFCICLEFILVYLRDTVEVLDWNGIKMQVERMSREEGIKSAGNSHHMALDVKAKLWALDEWLEQID